MVDPGLGFRQFGRFEGLAKSGEKNGQNGQEMDMIWGMILRRGTDTLRLKSFCENGQSGQLNSGGVRTL